MKKLLSLALVVIFVLGIGVGVAMAGNDAPNGPHYNLNIIGVEKDKKTDMTDSYRHTIFVPVSRNSRVSSRIYLVQTPENAIDFRVCDGNGFDEAISCFDEDGDGEPDVIANTGAVFMLPANADWEWVCDSSGECEWRPTGLLYEVYVRAVGWKGGDGTITTCKMNNPDDPLEIPECSLDFVSVNSQDRPSKFKNVTRELTSICVDEDGDGDSDHCYSIFDDDMQYFWELDNNGLKLVQLRFYPLER